MKKKKCPPREIVTYRLVPGGEQPMTLAACEFYSAERIAVEQGENYEVLIAPGQRWVDLWIPADPIKGCFNPLAILKGMRVPGARCFTVCAAYDENEDNLFHVPVGKSFRVLDGTSRLSFFANDCEEYYENNKGSIKVTVKRIS